VHQQHVSYKASPSVRYHSFGNCCGLFKDFYFTIIQAYKPEVSSMTTKKLIGARVNESRTDDQQETQPRIIDSILSMLEC